MSILNEIELLVENNRSLSLDLADSHSMSSHIKVNIRNFEQKELGYLYGRIWHSRDIFNADLDVNGFLYEAMDGEDQEGTDCYNAMIRILKRNGEDEITENFLEISKILINPEHRNMGVGRFCLSRFLISYAELIRFVLVQPHPFEIENPTKEEVAKLKKWYRSLGFKSIAGTDYMFLDLENSYSKIKEKHWDNCDSFNTCYAECKSN